MPPLCIHRALRAQIDGLNFVSISRLCILMEHTQYDAYALLEMYIFKRIDEFVQNVCLLNVHMRCPLSA